MTTSERAYERLVTANPVADPERFMAADIHTTFHDFQEGMMSARTTTHEVVVAKGQSPRRWKVATAAFVAVLALGAAVLIAVIGDDTRDATGTATDVVNTFMDHWNDGDSSGAVALLDPDVRIAGMFGIESARGLIEFSSQFDGRMETTCTEGSSPEQVVCDWAWDTAGVEALGLPGLTEGRIDVVDGRITAIYQSPDYNVWEKALSEYAQAQDPGGFAAACSPDGVSPMGRWVPHTAACGGFLAGLDSAFVESLSG